ncbi:MAG TPA: DUF4097 family beta strand repeat-containing protein [Gemmatimonadota bacterium]|jgi:hypothetical protein|nr:DUF4097 family beta strand repeat-containing protein [Gemmatimonadota bacterium]
MQPTRISIVAAAFVTLACAPAAAQREDTFRWSGQLAAGKTIEVSGINGDVQARPSSGRTVEVVARKHGDDDDPRAIDIDVIEGTDGIEVCAVYPGRGGSRNSTCDHGDDGDDWEDNDVVVDFTISVPPGVAFDGSTVNGGIDVSGLSSDVSVSTVNGGIEVASTGTVEAHTVNGSINASTEAPNWSGTLEFKTVNGSIHLSLPAGAGATVSAQTLNGDFSSDFPLTVEAGEWGPKKVSGSIGSGGGRLELETVNGEIEIRKS